MTAAGIDAKATMETPDNDFGVGPRLVRTAALMLVTVVVAVLALDDITTDNDTNLGFERFALLCCWTWLAVVAARLMREHRTLGLISVGLLGFAAPFLGAIGPGIQPGLSLEYVVTLAFLMWFTGLSVYLAAPGWRIRRRPAAPTGQ